MSAQETKESLWTTFAVASKLFGVLALVGPLTVVLYPWAFGFGALAILTGLIGGWRRSRLGLILGIVAPLASLIEILILDGSH